MRFAVTRRTRIRPSWVSWRRRSMRLGRRQPLWLGCSAASRRSAWLSGCSAFGTGAAMPSAWPFRSLPAPSTSGRWRPSCLSLSVAAALLGTAAWIARDERLAPYSRDSATLTLALAAALAASPILWIHYFLLLLVPIALARPRLSLLWFVPFAYYPLGETAWPTGDARKLGLALVTTLAIVAVSLRHDLRQAEHRGPPAGAPHSPALAAKSRTRARSLSPEGAP